MELTQAVRVLGFVTYSCVMALVIQSGIWMMDREPPLKVLTSQAVPPSYPGGRLLIEGDAIRDISRECSFVAHHWIEDHKQYRHYLPDVSMGYASIRRMEEVSPSRIKYAINIPAEIPIGPAVYQVEQMYECNPLHQFWPIRIETRIPFVLEPRP